MALGRGTSFSVSLKCFVTVLPVVKRQPYTNLYLFCRVSLNLQLELLGMLENQCVARYVRSKMAPNDVWF